MARNLHAALWLAFLALAGAPSEPARTPEQAEEDRRLIEQLAEAHRTGDKDGVWTEETALHYEVREQNAEAVEKIRASAPDGERLRELQREIADLQEKVAELEAERQTLEVEEATRDQPETFREMREETAKKVEELRGEIKARERELKGLDARR